MKNKEKIIIRIPKPNKKYFLNLKSQISNSSGQSLVELLLAIGLAAILIPALLTGLITSRQGKVQQAQRTTAVGMAKEVQEAVKTIRNNDWITFANLSGQGTLHPVISGANWATASGSLTVNGITQQFTVSNVYRDTSGNIVASTAPGATNDPSTKQVAIAVSWTTPIPNTINSALYLTRTTNVSTTQTTTSDFNLGTLTGVQVATASGGEVMLQSNKAKWCTPSFASTSIDLPDGPPVAVDATASASIAIPNDVFVASAPTATSSTKLAYVTVSANADPPSTALKGTFTLDSTKYSAGTYPSSLGGLTNSFKTNDVKYYKSTSGKLYALLATDVKDHEVVVAQINNGSGDAYQDSVNHIYKYWTYFNTRINPVAYNIPSANAAETSSSGDNNGFETSPTNAYVNDGSYAVDTNSGTNTGTSCTGTDKDKHQFYNFGLSVASGATINGIDVSLGGKVDSTTGTPKYCVQLSWDGGTTWTTAKSTGTLTTSDADYTLGGSADTWGRTWSDTNFTDANFRVRIIMNSSNTSRDFSLDWLGVKVYYNGGSSTLPNDHAPFDYGGKSLTISGNTGYVASGGYLYTFDLSNIDSKSPTSSLDQLGCRIELDGFDCKPSTGTDRKYSAGETGDTWSTTTSPAHNDCSDGGNVELNADDDITALQVGSNKYVYVAVGAGTNPEFEIVNTTSVPTTLSSPAINNVSCGRISGGNSGWKVAGSLDFNTASNTEEAANSVFAKSDGTRAYVSSNGGIDGNGDGKADSDQFYIIDTSTATAPKFLSGTPATGATSGYYNGSGANIQMYPRRSMTVLNGQRAVLVGKDAIADTNNAQEYQVINMTSPNSESSPAYCGGLDYDTGFNDLTSVTEADGDNFVYMVANTTTNELKIIQGGPDAQYLSPGTFESSTYDSNSANAAFNRVLATVSQPANTTIKMQTAVANAPANGNCSSLTSSSFTYVGPLGTTSDYYTAGSNVIQGAIPLISNTNYNNPGRCYRYKVWLDSSDQNYTPILYDSTVNYSP